MSENILGVYARFYTNPSESKAAADLREYNKEQFNEFLWGLNGVGGLSERLNKLKANDYGADLKKILIQFNVDPVPGWPQPGKELENYRPTEKAVGVWIIVDRSNFFQLSEGERLQEIGLLIIDRLEGLKKRFSTGKLDIDMDRLVKDVRGLLA